MVLFMCEGMYLKKITLSYTDAWLPCTLQQSSKRGLIQLAAAFAINCHGHINVQEPSFLII